MFPRRYFPTRFFTARYWAQLLGSGPQIARASVDDAVITTSISSDDRVTTGGLVDDVITLVTVAEWPIS